MLSCNSKALVSTLHLATPPVARPPPPPSPPSPCAHSLMEEPPPALAASASGRGVGPSGACTLKLLVSTMHLGASRGGHAQLQCA
eukprot:5114375-Pyramimonas_sp.AAC.1